LNQSTHANKPSSSSTSASTSAFGSSTQQPSSGHTFGQTSFGQQPQQSAFGSTIKPTSGGFSAYADAYPSSFAAAANQNRTSESSGFAAFAEPQSAFSAGASGTSGFGAPAPVFGQPAFAALQNQPANAFGQQQSVFGQPKAHPQSAFGQPTSHPQSAFGQPTSHPQSAFGQPTSHPQSAFGQPQSQAPSVFSALSAQSRSGFGASSLNNSQPSSAFTPLSNPANPLNAPSSFNPLESLGPSGAFVDGPGGPITNDATMASPFTPTFSSSSGAATTTNASSTNPLTHPKTKPDFARLLTKVRAKPGYTPYDSLLGPEYAKMVPQRVMEVFMKDRFEFGQVPDWVPPLEVR